MTDRIKMKDLFEEVEQSFDLYDSNKDACVILFRGRRVIVSSGKSLWTSKGPARAALTNHLYSFKRQIGLYDAYDKDQRERRMKNLKKFDEWVAENIKVVSLVEYENLQTKLSGK